MTALPHDEKLRDSTPAPAEGEETNYTSPAVRPLDPEATNYAPADPEATRYRTATPAGCRSPASLPCRFGEYELLEEVARGGMGVIYMARHTSLHRIVALKMILAGRLASAELIQRFYLEARAAADLDHPGIVPIYEIGEVDGRHYFTMAYLPGGSLQQTLEKGPLPPKVAARVVQQVAEAVQYAHDKGIIHRDIKPHNILLQADDRTEGSSVGPILRQAGAPASALPTPRLSDFGLARLSQESGLSLTGEVLGTPSYMPPEQAAGKRGQVGPHSDIYSLGAVLYCLLTGRPPFQAASALETLSLVEKSEPVPPRQLNPTVPRDLETICLKCLSKEPAKRYPSALALAQDLARFQSGQPIQARRVGRLERSWKWVRRNKALAALLATLGVVIVGSLIAVSGLYLRAERQRQLAVHREQGARAITRFYEDHVLAAARPKGWEGGTGKDVSLQEALNQAGPKIEEAFAGQPELEAAVRHTLGMTYYYLGQYEAANPHLEKAHQIRLEQFGTDHPTALANLHDLAMLRWRQDRIDEAIALARQALPKRRRVLGAEHPDTLFTQLNLGLFLFEKGQLEEAEALLRQAIESCKRTLAPDHHHTLYGQNDLALLLEQKGQVREALALHRQTLEGRRRSLGPEHFGTLLSLHNVGWTLEQLGRLDEAEQMDRQALEASRRILGSEHPNTLMTEDNLGDLLRCKGQYPEAETLLRHSREGRNRILGPEHHETFYSQNHLALLLEARGKTAEAEKLLREVLDNQRRLLGPDHADLAYTMTFLGSLLTEIGRPTEAEPLLRQGLAIWDKNYSSEYWQTLNARSVLGGSLTRQGKFAEAERYLLPGSEGLIRAKEMADEYVARALDRVIELYEKWGKPQQAEAWRQKRTPLGK